MKLTITPRRAVVLLTLAALLYFLPTGMRGAGPGYLLFPAGHRFTDGNNAICNGCKVQSYLAGTTTPTSTYSDQALTVPNVNPIVLNAGGQNPAGGIYGADASTIAYKFVLQTATGSTIWTQDQVAIPATATPPAPAAVPTGTVFPYAAAAAPSGYLLCDGSAISRTTFSGLFAVISTTFGVGDGSTTYNLPDMRGRYAFGKATSGTGSTLGAAFGLIDHTHTSAAHTHTGPSHAHTFTTSTPSATNAGVQTGSGQTVSTDTHTHTGLTEGAGTGVTGSTTPGVTGTANPPSVTFAYIIKT